MATPFTQYQSELEMSQDTEGGVQSSPLPPLEPVHPNLQRVLQRTLSRKRGEAAQPWEPELGRVNHRHSLLLLRPLAQSQPALSSRGNGAVWRSHYTLQRTPGTNSINRHLEGRREGSALRVPSQKYLEQVCRLLDKIADLQERNSLLKQDKLQIEEKLRQKEKQLELLQHYCSCGSAAVFLQWAGQPGQEDTQLLTHSFTSPVQCQLPDSLQHPRLQQHSSLQKRWASDSGTLWPGNGSSVFPLDECDSCQSESKEHLTSDVHQGSQTHNTGQDTKAPQAGWGRMREILHRLTDTSRTRRTFATRFKGSTHQKHRQKNQEI
ncbi:hypothetical protein chiPu_0016982 [Chiloscyllium punctatum]|uniref:Uncharacterized protein n=1 Tax=Chiloscyllium punctatum TaxID=137246 RepID=A0A401T748_CHIPU|nr:hypothetical protein [Chiloscyllium punctatum]